jgi:peptide/nickel transport system permease protein
MATSISVLASVEGEPGQSDHMSLLRRLRSAPTLHLILRRLLQAIPTMFAVSFITFALMNLLPGGAATAIAGAGSTKAEINALAVRLHLNEPFLERYFRWLGGIVTGHPGNALASGLPVTSVLAQRLPVTLELVILALALAVSLSIVAAVLSARKPGGIADHITDIVTSVGLSIPPFVLGLFLSLFLAVHLRLLPAIGFTSLSQGIWPNLKTMIMPAGTLGFALFCNYARVLRADLLDQMNSQDYTLMASAKGLSRTQVLIRHALRNSMFGLLTLVGLNLGVLIGGTVVIEEVFGVPGVGQQLIQSILDEDVIMVEAIVVVLSIAVILSNLITDLLYSVLDPRVRHERSSG